MLTQEQIYARRNGLGGSDLAAIAGLSKYKTAVDVYLEKIGDTVELEVETEAQWWGTEKEPSIVKRYEMKTGKVCSIEPNLIVHPEYFWMIGNVDRRILAENAILECKTAHEFLSKEWGEPGSDVMPDAYLLQCAHYAIITNAAYVDLAVLIGSADFRIYRYNRNEALENKIIEMEARFWNEHVLKRVPPEIKSVEDLMTLFPVSDDKVVTANSDVTYAVYRLNRLKKLMNKIEKKQKDLKFEIQLHMEDADTLIDADGNKLATWKTQNRKEHFVRASSARVFNLSKNLEA